MMVRLVTEPETVVKSRRVVAARETLLEFTVRAVAEPETLAEITAGWSKMVTKPRTCIGRLNTPQKPRNAGSPHKKAPTPKNSIRHQGSYTPPVFVGLSVLARKTKARVKML